MHDTSSVRRVLIVDDDATVRMLASTALEDAGFHVVEAESGVVAMELIEQVCPDVVFLDVVMPGMDGFQACRAIRNNPAGATAAIMMMTGLDDLDSIQKAYDAGATDFITKPINWILFRHRANFMFNAKRADDQIRHQALYDPLTGLPNRTLLHDRLTQSIQHATRFCTCFAVMFIDLDYFKDVNDNFGHDTGDALLRSVAERLQSTTRGSDTCARLGGDEFVVAIQDVHSYEDVRTVAQLLLDHFSQPFLVDGHEILLSSSIGIAVYPGDGVSAGDLVKNADTAMNFAKKLGKNCLQFFSAEMQSSIQNRMIMQNELRKALESDELTLHYQPRVDSLSGCIIGMEALVRWHHPVRGLLIPQEFIPLAEESGQIVALGEWVLYEACNQAANWQQIGFPPLKISVNFSPVQFQRSNVLEMVRHTLLKTGLPPGMLEIEITEGTLMQSGPSLHENKVENFCSRSHPGQYKMQSGVPPLAEVLNSLQQLGVSIALDDFGTGYSSLSYLNQFPIDVLKIDHSFVNDSVETSGSPIIAAIIAMADKLNLRVVAEGVETAGQRRYLVGQACHELQGFLTGRPMCREEFEQMFISSQPGIQQDVEE